MGRVALPNELLPSEVFLWEQQVKKLSKEIKEIRHLAMQCVGTVKMEWFAEQLRRKLEIRTVLIQDINKARFI